MAKIGLVVLVGVVLFRCTAAMNDAASRQEGTSAAPPPAAAPARDAGASMTQTEREETAAEWLAFVEDESQPLELRAVRAQALVKQFGDTKAAAEAKDLAATLNEQAQAAGNWNYREETDPLTQRKAFIATVQSENTLNLDFPYEGAQRATLAVRNHPEFGRSVIVSIREGQILCRSYGDCPIRIAFDDGSPRTIDGDPPSDHGSETVFLPWNLASRITKADEMRVQFNIYQHGAPTMVFDVRGLDMERLK